MTTSTNQFQKPITANINTKGNIEIGSCDLERMNSELLYI